jgi:hypothetical protein
MTFQTSGRGVVDRMTIGAGGAVMVETASFATRVGVVKVRIPIARGMALHTICAELPDMGGRLGMAGNTISRRVYKDVIDMAPGAGHANVCAGQWEGSGVPKLIMRKMKRVDECQRGVRTAVIRVTGPARTAHPALQQRSVQGLWIKLLGSNVGMAFHAQGRHPRGAPEGRMTGWALCG